MPPTSGNGGGGVQINNQDKTITANGTYTADEGFTGLGNVTVNVAATIDGGEMMDALITRSITEINYNGEVIGDSAFRSCKNLTTANLPNVVEIPQYAFYNCSLLSDVKIPNVEEVKAYSFQYCTALTKIEFSTPVYIWTKALGSCTALKALIIRDTSNRATLGNTDAIEKTPIKDGNGFIYVPKVFLEGDKTYTTMNNWKTYAAQFRALEDYTVDGTVTGELDETKI